MSAIAVSSIVFACIFGGALLGALLRRILPESHLNSESKEIVKLGTGLIGTMAALVLGLMVASAKSSYDTQKNEVTEMAANFTWLDRVLAHYGPEAQGARELLRRGMPYMIGRIWSNDKSAPANPHAEATYDAIQQLPSTNDAQRALKAEALGICVSLGRTRSLLFQQVGSSISLPFLIVVVFWLTIIFVSFGLFGPPNATVIVTLLVCALSVAGAIFLILELDHPFSGLIQISSEPLRNALSPLGG
jgi:hypothetical protein